MRVAELNGNQRKIRVTDRPLKFFLLKILGWKMKCVLSIGGLTDSSGKLARCYFYFFFWQSLPSFLKKLFSLIKFIGVAMVSKVT